MSLTSNHDTGLVVKTLEVRRVLMAPCFRKFKDNSKIRLQDLNEQQPQKTLLYADTTMQALGLLDVFVGMSKAAAAATATAAPCLGSSVFYTG
jgi:hypothetical protein